MQKKELYRVTDQNVKIKLSQRSPWVHFVICNLSVCLLYLIAAYFGLKLAIPPGYATAIWAPSGFALGAVLVWGRRSLLGVFVGSFIINCYISYLSGGDLLAFKTQLIAAFIGVGALLQAWLGWYLIKRKLGLKNTLDYPKDILWFALLSGPIACLVNATLSNFVLFFFNILPLAAYPVSWATWWIGDSIGALIFTPLFLICFASPRIIWRARLLQVLLPLSVSFVVVVFVYGFVSKTETRRVNNQFQHAVSQKMEKIDNKMLKANNLSTALATHLSIAPTLNQKTFTDFSASLKEQSPYIQSLEWVAKLRSSEKFKHRYGIDIFQYHDSSWLEKTTISSPVSLMRKAKKSMGVLILTPVYRNLTLSGFALVVVDVTKLVNPLLEKTKMYHNFIISDITDTQHPRVVYTLKNTLHISNDPRYVLNVKHVFHVNNRTWEVNAISSQHFISSHYSWQVWSVLVGGLLFISLMNLMLFILYGQKNIIQSKVEEQASRLRNEEAKNLLLLNSVGEGIMGLDDAGHISFVNPAASTLLGYTEKELNGQSIDILISNNKVQGRPLSFKRSAFFKSITKNKVYHINDNMFQCKNGKSFWVEYTSTPLKKLDQITGVVVVFNDVSERRKTDLKLEKMAHYDLLTGLPNRFSFLAHLTQALARAKRCKSSMLLCFIDVDNFKEINDNLGHAAGDDLLRLIPKLLSPKLRDVDYLARLGGDEFGLILENPGKVSEVGFIIERYIETMAQPLQINHFAINTSISVGVAVYPTAGITADELVKNADIAMYRAKDAGKNTYAFFNEATNIEVKRRHSIEVGLRKAIQSNEFQLFYQPQLDIKTHKIMGIEALIRWHNADLQTVSPAEFIPIAEDNGMIHIIGEWVLEQLGRDYKALHAINSELEYSVNVSVKQLEKPRFDEFIKGIIDVYQINPNNLLLEITETALMRHPDEMLKIMSRLEQLGIRFALDDFGIGYSSMQYLKRLPISLIKIDQSFVSDIVSDPNDAAIVKATIQLSHGLGISSIAEGVETKEQLEFLAESGCEYVQGYYFSKPLSLKDLSAWMQQREESST